MILVALDVSTKTGYAIFRDGVLRDSGTLWLPKEFKEYKKTIPYPQSYLQCADDVVKLILELIYLHSDAAEHLVPEVVVEETTASSNNYSQKILEFIHHQLLVYMPDGIRVSYVRDGVWKKMTGANQNKEERNLNAKIARIKKKTGKKLAKIDGKVVGKLKRQDYYIRAANERFGKELKKKDENEAAALLLGAAYLMGAPTCNGTDEGGLLPKTNEVVVS